MKSVWKRIIFFLTLVLILGVGELFMPPKTRKKDTGSEQEQPIVTQQMEQPVEKSEETIVFNKDLINTSLWKNYKSERLGFEIKYPADVYKVVQYEDAGVISFVVLDKKLSTHYKDVSVQLVGNGEIASERYGKKGGIHTTTSLQRIMKETFGIRLKNKVVHIDPSVRYDCINNLYCGLSDGAYIVPENLDRFYWVSYSDGETSPNNSPQEASLNANAIGIMQGTYLQFLTELKPL